MAPTPYLAAPTRYDVTEYRRCGASGLKLPPISLGLWQNFGDDRPLATSRAILRRAFDLGITHFDLANNYGPPYGSAEINFGRIFAEDFRPYRDELIISTKAGYDMWPGPYGEWGSRKYLLASLDQSLCRMGLEYVDIFYSHRFDPDTPLQETMGALDTAVRAGKARYVGISSYGPQRTEEAAAILRRLGTPLLIHQPSYSMFNRWIEDGLLDVLAREGVGAIAFSPFAQGLLTDATSTASPRTRAPARGNYFSDSMLTDENLARARALNEIAQRRGQSLAQMAVAWVLRDPRVTSALLGASASPSSSRTWPLWPTSTSAPMNWRRSTATPSTARSTSGKRRAAPERIGRLCRDDLPVVVDVGLGRPARDVHRERPVGAAAAAADHSLGLAVETGSDHPRQGVVAGGHRRDLPVETSPWLHWAGGRRPRCSCRRSPRRPRRRPGSCSRRRPSTTPVGGRPPRPDARDWPSRSRSGCWRRPPSSSPLRGARGRRR